MEASSGRFVLQVPVGRSMEASSGCYLTEAPVGRFLEASSGHLCQVAPIGWRFQKAFNGRFNIKTPTGRFQKASSGCFLGRAASGHAIDLTSQQVVFSPAGAKGANQAGLGCQWANPAEPVTLTDRPGRAQIAYIAVRPKPMSV
ncbi:hypothetical protein PCANC_11554 [Puccinia coronata f. sp. avenae]|uniref:Uncharacterized protein n=1 Tax=Puccinia coronata f. sp. avenae TaxID=200324 RepID=A0A2N5TFX0_9BASI|nr:hypothetical protein PCANC_13908 [Puccinia coronata f. sp. avenae]PLW24404.1 hypothetical protein PCASD_08383 [Puccinia coronata f. sp. avenae]PLW40010.1 hypothetical protein PCANC_11554 [Puccinia coronata f. sp. avenae]PLW42942.1 hypothetical protein PCASD_04714 [Puccinia coronata f. sp. avenae]